MDAESICAFFRRGTHLGRRFRGTNQRTRQESERRRPLGVTLGRLVKGCSALWTGDDGEVVLSMDQLGEQVLTLGRSGSGQSAIVSRVLEGVTREDPSAQILLFDGQADPGLASLFREVMLKRGRVPLFFPEQPFNAWPGDSWLPIFNRVLQIIPFAKSEAAAYYTDAATVILQLACRLNDEPPRSRDDLLSRLDFWTLSNAYGEEEMKGIKVQHVEDVYMRCKAVFAHFGNALDGEKSFIDLDSAYFGLDALTMGKSAVVTMKMLLSQLSDYISYEKDPDRRCVVFVHAPGLLEGNANWASFQEQARKLGVTVVLIAQSLSEVGDAKQVARTLHNTGTFIAHSYLAWEQLETVMGPTESVEAPLSPDAGRLSRVKRKASRMLRRGLISRRDLHEMPANGRMVVFRSNSVALID